MLFRSDGDGDGTRGDGSEEMRGLSSFAFRAALMHGATCDINALRAGPAAVMIAPADLALAAMLAEADMRPDRKLLMLYPRLYAHLRMILAANSASGRPADDGTSADVAAMDLGFVRPPQTEGPSLFRKLLDLADRCGFPWEVADSRLPPERLLDYALVVCPTLEMLDHPTMQHLDDFVSINRGYAAIGPRVPMLNEQLRGERTLARHFEKELSEFAQEIYRVGDGVFFTLPGFMSAATIDFLCFESGLARGLTATQPQPSTMQPDLTVVDEDLDVVVHRNGRRRMVFVANPTSLPRTADLTREPVRRLIPLEPSADGLSQAASPVGPMRLTIPPKRIMVFAAE